MNERLAQKLSAGADSAEIADLAGKIATLTVGHSFETVAFALGGCLTSVSAKIDPANPAAVVRLFGDMAGERRARAVGMLQ